MIVMKFGGSSVESAAAIDRVAEIVRSRQDRRPVVVVSAMGKTTNRLLAIADSAAAGRRQEALDAAAELEHYTVSEGADLPEVRAIFAELRDLITGLSILGELTPRSIDAASAFGERISSLIVAERFRRAGLSAVQADSRQYIVTDSRHTQAMPLMDETRIRCAPLRDLAAAQVVVMGGFIASNQAGVTTTLGRGGSDYSAAILGAALEAVEIQIWTDVDGMLTCDPRVLPIGHRVRSLSFAEAAELSYFGAKVLHPSTVLPAIERRIPVLILNSRRPEVEGTRIVADPVRSTNPFKSIACKRGITAVHVRSTRMLMAHGFLKRIFEVFDRHETAVDLVATSEISVSTTIDNPRHIDAIAAELSAFSDVTIEQGDAMICMVGEGIGRTAGLAARIFAALRGINIRLISQGASQLNVSFVIAGADLEPAVAALHEEFFRELDPEVFERRAS